MNDIEKKELLVKDIEELESIKSVKLGENQNIIEGNRKIIEQSEQIKSQNQTIKEELVMIEPILGNKKKENEEWEKRIKNNRAVFEEKQAELSVLVKKINETNDLLNEAQKALGRVRESVAKKENDKFIIGRMKEILLQMFDEMRPIYKRAGAEFPYGSVDEVLSGLIKKDE